MEHRTQQIRRDQPAPKQNLWPIAIILCCAAPVILLAVVVFIFLLIWLKMRGAI